MRLFTSSLLSLISHSPFCPTRVSQYLRSTGFKLLSEPIKQTLRLTSFLLIFTRHKCLHIFIFLILTLSLDYSGLSSLFDDGTTLCPDNYAIEIEAGIYLRCEEFDEYYDKKDTSKLHKLQTLETLRTSNGN